MSDALFPFGFGLSYTTFSFGKATLNRQSIAAGDGVTLTIPVSNTGKRSGTEIVQVYVRKAGDDDGPRRTLRAFQRVTLAAGESKNVELNLGKEAFEFFDRMTGKMTVLPGDYEIEYGNSSDDADLKTEVLSINKT